MKCRKIYSLLLIGLLVSSAIMRVDAASTKLKTPTVTLSNVTASGKIKVDWNSVKGAKSYQVYRSTDGRKWSRLITTTKTEIVNTSTTPGKKYYYKVKALSSVKSRHSSFSKIKSRTCDLARPTVTLSHITSTGKIKVSWSSIEKAKSYSVYSSTNGTDWKLLTNTTKTNVTNTNAIAGKKYYYKVKAMSSNSAANSAYSSVKNKVCKLSKPEISLSTIESTGKTKISWTKITNAKSYDIFVSKDNKVWTRLGNTTKTSFIHEKGVANTKYYYKIQAISVNTDGNSTYSNVKYRTTSFVQSKENIYYAARPTITVYKEPTSNSDYIWIPYMDAIELGEAVKSYASGSWNKLKYKNETYYIWLEPSNDKLVKIKSSFSYVGKNEYQQEVIDLATDIALNWNTIYAHGQSKGVKNDDGTYGFDCSGFSSYVLNTVMQKRVPTYRLTSSVTKLAEVKDVYNGGYNGEFLKKTVQLKDIQPGDLIFFSLKSKNDHCGVYLGNNEFAHSTNSMNDVLIIPIYGQYLDKISGIYRYIPETISPANQTKELAVTCGFYAKRGDDSTKITSLKKGAKVTVLYTGNSDPSYNQAYIKTPDGKTGFVYTKNFK